MPQDRTRSAPPPPGLPHRGGGAVSRLWHDAAPGTAGHPPPCGEGRGGGERHLHTLSRRALLALGAAASATFATPAFARDTAILGGHAFGSYWRLTLPAGSIDPTAAIEAVVTHVDALFSPYRPNSALSRFNTADTTDWQPLPAELTALTTAALDLAARSGGAFDPTVGPLVARYGFGPIADAAPGRFTGLDCRDGALRKSSPGLSIDLCGIAKGHALDLMAAGLDALGLADYVLELGGEVFARGRHPAGRPWQVAVEHGPLLTLEDEVVATSGDTVQAYEIAGRRYGHIIDPSTGAPATGGLASVSVLARNAAAADGWATALFVLGAGRGPALAETEGLDALFLLRDGTPPLPTGRMSDRLLA